MDLFLKSTEIFDLLSYYLKIEKEYIFLQFFTIFFTIALKAILFHYGNIIVLIHLSKPNPHITLWHCSRFPSSSMPF